MKNFNLQNIKKDWKISVLGGIISLSATSSVLLGVSTWIEATPVIIIGLALLPYKRPSK